MKMFFFSFYFPSKFLTFSFQLTEPCLFATLSLSISVRSIRLLFSFALIMSAVTNTRCNICCRSNTANGYCSCKIKFSFVVDFSQSPPIWEECVGKREENILFVIGDSMCQNERMNSETQVKFQARTNRDTSKYTRSSLNNYKSKKTERKEGKNSTRKWNFWYFVIRFWCVSFVCSPFFAETDDFDRQQLSVRVVMDGIAMSFPFQHLLSRRHSIQMMIISVSILLWRRQVFNREKINFISVLLVCAIRMCPQGLLLQTFLIRFSSLPVVFLFSFAHNFVLLFCANQRIKVKNILAIAVHTSHPMNFYYFTGLNYLFFWLFRALFSLNSRRNWVPACASTRWIYWNA